MFFTGLKSASFYREMKSITIYIRHVVLKGPGCISTNCTDYSFQKKKIGLISAITFT